MGIVITSDPSRYIKWFFRINRDNVKTFRFLNSNGTAKDLTGFVFQVNIRKDKDDDDNILELTEGSGLTTTDNEVVVTVDKDEAADFSDDVYFIEWVVTEGGRERNWLSGDAVFHNGRFDGVSCDRETLIIKDSSDVVEITVTDSGGGGSSTRNQWIDTDYDPVNDIPESGGSGDGGEIESGDKWKFNGPGDIHFDDSITKEVADGVLLEAMIKNPGKNKQNWYLNYAGE